MSSTVNALNQRGRRTEQAPRLARGSWQGAPSWTFTAGESRQAAFLRAPHLRFVNLQAPARSVIHLPPCVSVQRSTAVTMSGADTAGSASPAPPNLPNDGQLGHERPAFVTPRDFLQQSRPSLPARALTAVDREQLDGLVRVALTAMVRCC